VWECTTGCTSAASPWSPPSSPWGLQRGTEAEFHLEGVHLGQGPRGCGLDQGPGRRGARDAACPSVHGGRGAPVGLPSVVVDEFPRWWRGSKGGRAAVCRGTPTAGSSSPGRPRPGASGPSRTAPAPGGQRPPGRLPLDWFIEVLDAQGRRCPGPPLCLLGPDNVAFPRPGLGGPGHPRSMPGVSWPSTTSSGGARMLIRITTLPGNPDDG